MELLAVMSVATIVVGGAILALFGAMWLDRKEDVVLWGTHTIRSVRSWKHDLFVDDVRVASSSSVASLEATLPEAILGEVRVEARVIPEAGASLWVDGEWIGGARPAEIPEDCKPAKFPEPSDPRWLAASHPLSVARKHANPEIREAAKHVANTLHGALLALDRAQEELLVLERSEHPSASSGAAILRRTMESWEEIVGRQIELLHQIHALALGTSDALSVNDLIERSKAEAEIQSIRGVPGRRTRAREV